MSVIATTSVSISPLRTCPSSSSSAGACRASRGTASWRRTWASETSLLWRPEGGGTYFAVIAPSATITEPVTNDDSSEARNSATLAISRGSPGRPIGWNESIVA